MRFLLMALASVLAQVASAAGLEGIWKGELTQDPGGCYPRYTVEFQIHLKGNELSGQIYDYYDTTKFVRLSFTGTYDPRTKKLVIEENKVIQVSIPEDCVPCIKTYELKYSVGSAGETLIGEWRGHIQSRMRNCPPGRIILHKVPSSDFPEDLDQPDSLASLESNLHLPPRNLEIVRTLTLNVPRIKLELYDNAEIDNDTISVFINGKLLLYQQRLSEKPLTLFVNAIPDKEYELVIFADNLGSIPPNTALMVVTAGRKTFDIFLSSSEQKSAGVKFTYHKE